MLFETTYKDQNGQEVCYFSDTSPSLLGLCDFLSDFLYLPPGRYLETGLLEGSGLIGIKGF